MYKLYHYSLCPFSRMIRFILNEMQLEYILIEEKFWEYNEQFLQLNPAGTVPVMITKNGDALNHSHLILDYLLETYKPTFIFPEENSKLQTKKILLWYTEKFFLDCTKFFIQEKAVKYFHEKAQPNTNILGMARYNLGIHFDYTTYLLEQNTWLGGEKFSIADIAAATQFSSLDFLGEVQWSKIPQIKDWYSIVKSKPSFRPLLKERIAGILTPQHYTNLDF